MASKKKKQTATPQAPESASAGGAGEAEPVAPAAPPAEAPPAGESVRELDEALTAAPAAKDSASAAAAFQQAEFFAAAAPAATQDAKRGRGRPKGSTTAPKSAAGGAAPPPAGAAPPPRDYSRMTKAELISSVQQLSARVDAMNPSGAPGIGEIAEARKTVEGLLELANFALKLRNVPEFITSKEENEAISDAAAEPIAPYLRQLGAAQPWVRLAGAVLIVYAPKTVAYMERRELEKAGKPTNKKEIVITESDARTASGGVTGAPPSGT